MIPGTYIYVCILPLYAARELAHLPFIAHAFKACADKAILHVAQALKTCADELSYIGRSLKTCADDLSPIAHPFNTCADELSPIAQAGEACVTHVPPIAHPGTNEISSFAQALKYVQMSYPSTAQPRKICAAHFAQLPSKRASSNDLSGV